MPRLVEKTLTDAAIRSMSTDRLKTVRDAAVRGFGVRVSPAETKTFVYEGRINGRQRRIGLGRYPAVSLKDARLAALGIIDKLQAGIDPVEEERGALTFGEVADRFLSEHVERNLRPISQRDYRLILQGKYVATIRDKPISKIAKSDINKVLDAAGDKQTMSNRVLAVVKKCLNWSAERGYIDHSPARDIKKRYRDKARDRVLSKSELLQIWHAIQAETAFRQALSFLYLTMLRSSEVSELRWSEVHDLDGDEPHLLIGADRMKANELHYVPLSPPLVMMLRSLPRAGEFVFSTDGGKSHIWLKSSKTKARLDARMAEEGEPIVDWKIHDLRRSLATLLAEEYGVSDDLIEELLAHKRQGIRRVYNRAVRKDQRRKALEQLAKFVGAAVPGID